MSGREPKTWEVVDDGNYPPKNIWYLVWQYGALLAELNRVTAQRDAMKDAVKNAEVLISSLPDFTFGEVLEEGDWDGFCDSTGTDKYGMSEGKFDSDESARSMTDCVSDNLRSALRLCDGERKEGAD